MTHYLTRHAWKRFYQKLRVTLMCHTQVNSVNVTHYSENTPANRRAANSNCKAAKSYILIAFKPPWSKILDTIFCTILGSFGI